MRKIKNSKIGDKKERYKALEFAISTQPNIFFDVVDPVEFSTEYNKFLVLDADYNADKLIAQKHNNIRYKAAKRLARRTRNIASYLKVKFDKSPKTLGDWGLNQIYAVDGRIVFPTTNNKNQELFVNILAKHLLDDVDIPLLIRFDMQAFADDLQELSDEKASFRAKQSSWRSKSMYRRSSMKLLDKMMSRITRDLVSREDVLWKDLEHWGFLLAEQPLSDDNELPMAS